MNGDVAGDRPQDVGRSHSRRRRVTARALTESERLELLSRPLVDAYREAIAAATWLYAADELTVRLLADVLAALDPPAPGGTSVVGGPMPAPTVPLADRLKLWQLARDLAGELGLSADARRRIGLELTPPPERTSPSRSTSSSSSGPSRRRRVDFGERDT